MPKVIRGGSREETFDRFTLALADPTGGTVPLLFVDSECPVAAEHSVWKHLYARDRWRKPTAARNDQAFLMVQVMETWFLADPKALQTYFGAHFTTNAIRKWHRLEDLPRETVYDALEKATTKCSKVYAKGKVAFELLKHINAALVEAACPMQRIS